MRRTATKAIAAPTRVSGSERARLALPLWLLALLLLLVTMALYWPATRCDFVNLDDDLHVTANLQVQQGLSLQNIKWAFLNPVAHDWHPLSVCSHMLDCQLFRLNPWGHHLTSVLLHTLNAGLVFALLQAMTGARWRSLWVAALFAVHPLRVESVAWVTERKDVLSALFGLLALMAYARYAEVQSLKSKVQPAAPAGQRGESPKSVVRGPWSLFRLRSPIFYLLSLFCFALGLMSKPMLVTWPLVMILLDYWPLRRFQFKTQDSRLKTSLPLLLEKLPFFALAALASVVTFAVQKRGGVVAAVEHMPLGARAGNALISYCRYLGKLFWPTDLAVMYPHPGYWPLAKVLLAGGGLLGLSVLVWVGRRRYPYLLMGWLWYCGTLVPVSQMIQTGSQAMADRWTYLPSLGMLIMVVWGAYELTRRWQHQVLGLSMAGGAAVGLCLALTWQQIGYWKDSEALFWHALEVTENNYVAHGNLGAALDKKGQTDEAMHQFREALRLGPQQAEAHNNLGAALDEKDQIDEAIRQYQKALRLKPSYAEAHNNLGTALGKKGQTDEAIRQYQEALRLKPDYAEAHYNLGAALGRKGQSDEAIRQYQEAVRLKPDYADAHNNLGAALDDRGQSDEAIRHYQAALRLKPNHAEAHNNLGIALGRKGQSDEALLQFQEAVRLKPDYAEAHNNLGIAFYQQHRTGEAIRQFQEALRLKPDYAGARQNLDAVLATGARSSPPPGSAPSP